MKLSIRQISKESDITWHPLTQILHQSFISCYEDSFIQRLSTYSHYHKIPQTIYVFSSGIKKKKSTRKKEINDTVKNFQIISGIFNPFFDTNYFEKGPEHTIFIEVSKSPNETEEVFQNKLIQFILADFFKSVCTGNMKKIARSFAVIAKNNEHPFNEPLQQFFETLTNYKLTGENYTSMLGIGRDTIYKQK